MRVIAPICLLLGLSGCADAPETAWPYRTVTLPYADCGRMAALRTNLTGTPYPSPRSDAQLWALGVRCVANAYSTYYPTVRARY